MGACHGNGSGKGGFKLSLRGEDPASDYLTLTRGQLARRLDLLDPGASLLLRKTTNQIPHEGGRRVEPGSIEHQLLLNWIAAGAPATPQGDDRQAELIALDVKPDEAVLNHPRREVRISVTARFADGTATDVSRLAVYEPVSDHVTVGVDGLVKGERDGQAVIIVRYLNMQRPVRLFLVPDQPGFIFKSPPPANAIDRHVYDQLQIIRLNPAPPAGDEVFIRRVFLDVIGLPPTIQETRRFLEDRAADKRAKLIDRLLERPEFAEHWALKWSDLLRNEQKALDIKGVRNFHAWIRQSIQDRMPLNEFARRIISARGSTYALPPTNFYRSLRDPLSRAEAAAQVFLGTRLQCAKCHNHPFEKWTQDHYYSFAANFADIQYKIVDNTRRDNLDKHEFIGEQIVLLDPKHKDSKVVHPRTGKPASPGYLQDALDRSPAPRGADSLEKLADWIANPANPLFARVQANRIWYHMMGRGLVDPVDDFRATNPPSHPALLDELAARLAADGFDLRKMVRMIALSNTYQQAAASDPRAADPALLAGSNVRRLSAEQMIDAISLALDSPVKLKGMPLGTRTMQMPGVILPNRRSQQPIEAFLQAFGKPQRLLPSECERAGDTSLNQIMQMTTGPMLHELIAEPDNRLGRMLRDGQADERIIGDLYLATLSRAPTGQEMKTHVAYLRAASDRRPALEDICWALLNSRQFLLRW